MSNKFAQLDEECLASHVEQFLVPYFSVSSVATFIRNEKAFEKTYIFADYSPTDSLSSIIGKVYHDTIKDFFLAWQAGEKLTFAEAAERSFYHLDRIGAHRYRPQKAKSIVEQQAAALKSVNSLILNFFNELPVYEQEIAHIVAVEPKIVEFITLCGVDIPLPMKVQPDLLYIDFAENLSLLDHKAKSVYTAEGDITTKYGNQTIGYTQAITPWILKQEDILANFPTAKNGVQKFTFIENKHTANRDGSNQIMKIEMDLKDSREIYETLLFEAVYRLIEAVQNPDHIYTINPNDYFEDQSELLDFWVKTHIEGLEGFPNLTPNQIRILQKRKVNIRRGAISAVPKNVIEAFKNPKNFTHVTLEDMTGKSPAERIEYRLRLLNFPARVEHVIAGHSCDTYLLAVAQGLKIKSIFNYAMDIANALGKPDVRIAQDLVKYKGDSFVSVEVNREPHEKTMVKLGALPDGLKIPLGQNNFGEMVSWDLANPSTPHMMIAGASGSGKSVAIKTIIAAATKKKVKVVILDPKYEFTDYSDKYEVLNELEDIEAFMELMVAEVDRIFKAKGATGNAENRTLIIFDEAADCFAKQTKKKTTEVENGHYANGMPKTKTIADPKFKTLEENILILAQKARSAGFHLVLAAQRFSTKVLTGDAKANFPARLCLTVASSVDSKVMLDEAGAEKLSGKGDALYSSPEHGEPVRIQCYTI